MNEKWFGREFRHQKQSVGDSACVAYACAMAARVHVSEFFAMFPGRKGPYYDSEAVKFMAHHGWIVGYLGLNLGGDGVLLTRDNRFEFCHSMEWPALLSVRSRNYFDALHMVYWDGVLVQDPDPNADQDGEVLSNYAVCGVMPLTWGGASAISEHCSSYFEFDPSQFQAPREGSYCNDPSETLTPIAEDASPRNP